MVKSTGLELPFDLCRQPKPLADHHSREQSADLRIVLERLAQSSLNPKADQIASVPSAVQNCNETRVPNRPCPVDLVSLQIAAEVENAGVSINRRPPQL